MQREQERRPVRGVHMRERARAYTGLGRARHQWRCAWRGGAGGMNHHASYHVHCNSTGHRQKGSKHRSGRNRGIQTTCKAKEGRKEGVRTQGCPSKRRAQQKAVASEGSKMQPATAPTHAAAAHPGTPHRPAPHSHPARATTVAAPPITCGGRWRGRHAGMRPDLGSHAG